MAAVAEKSDSSNLIEIVYIVFVRLLALYFIASAIQYWLRLVGFYDGANFQFDTMALHWQVAAPILAVVQPIVALGLWGLFSWGAVVWFAAVVMEIAMHTFFRDLYGEARGLVVLHATTAGLFLVFLIGKRFITNKK